MNIKEDFSFDIVPHNTNDKSVHNSNKYDVVSAGHKNDILPSNHSHSKDIYSRINSEDVYSGAKTNDSVKDTSETVQKKTDEIYSVNTSGERKATLRKKRARSRRIRTAIVVLIILIVAAIVAVIIGKTVFNNNGYYDGMESGSEEYAMETDTDEEPTSSMTSENKTLNIDGGFVGKEITVEEEPVVSFTGYVSKDHSRCNYHYTAPRNGRYRFDFVDLNANVRLHLVVWDSNDNKVLDTYSGGRHVELKESETYQIQVQYKNSPTDFLLKLGVQKPDVDISDVTTVNDQIAFENQRNVYIFTAPVSGLYRFDLTEVRADVSLNCVIFDRLGNKMKDIYSNGFSVELNQSETYQIHIIQNRNLGNYVMRIFFQKNQQDISNYIFVYDSIEFEDQRNVYSYTPEESGEYIICLSEIEANASVQLMAWDRLDYEIINTYSNSKKVNLNAGETYQIQVRQDRGYSDYMLTVAIATN